MSAMYSLCLKLPELTWLAFPIRLKAYHWSNHLGCRLLVMAARQSYPSGLIPKPKSHNFVFKGPTKLGKDTGTGVSRKKPTETVSVKIDEIKL